MTIKHCIQTFNKQNNIGILFNRTKISMKSTQKAQVLTTINKKVELVNLNDTNLK